MLQLLNPRKSDPNRKKQLESCWQKVLSRPEVGFTQIPERNEEWKAVEERIANLKVAPRALILGIGGSSLGPQVIQASLSKLGKTEFYFLESPDPHLWSSFQGFSDPKWQDKHVIVVSKSGNTLETLAWLEQLSAHGTLENSQITVIASPGEGALQKWAKREGVACLWIPQNVGGRFSVLTSVGMLPAGLMGLSLAQFREGAKWSLQNVDLATAMSLEILASFDEGRWITQLWNYSGQLRIFGEWWQQLWGESLAKKTTRNGKEAPRVSTPMACTGPRDQHSLVQQLMEGALDKQVIVTRVKALESSEKFKGQMFPELPFSGKSTSLGQVLGAEADAFERSLSECRIPFCTLQLDQLNEKSLGALFMFWQMVIAQLGEYLEIDAFNQPGVELGKKYAFELLR